MKAYTPKTICKEGRISLHPNLKEKLGLEPRTKVILHPVDGKVIIKKFDGGVIPPECIVRALDVAGRIVLPNIIFKVTGWKIRDEVNVYLMDDGAIVLELA